MQMKSAKRTQSAIAEAATKEFEFEALSEFLPDLPDTDARMLALRMYYLELSENVSSSDAQTKVNKMFSISPRTVKRWATAWEDTGEEALIVAFTKEQITSSVFFHQLWLQRYSQAGNDKRWNKRSRTIRTTKSTIDALLDLLNCYISIPSLVPRPTMT